MERRDGDSWFCTEVNISTLILWSRDPEIGESTLLSVFEALLWKVFVFFLQNMLVIWSVYFYSVFWDRLYKNWLWDINFSDTTNNVCDKCWDIWGFWFCPFDLDCEMTSYWYHPSNGEWSPQTVGLSDWLSCSQRWLFSWLCYFPGSVIFVCFWVWLYLKEIIGSSQFLLPLHTPNSWSLLCLVSVSNLQTMKSMTPLLLIMSSILYTQASILELSWQMHDNRSHYLIMDRWEAFLNNKMDDHVVHFSMTFIICMSSAIYWFSVHEYFWH